MESEARSAVFMRLANLALPDTQMRGDILAAANPSPHGAIVAADGLIKVCGANVYCTGGSVVLRVLDAIFGSSSKSANYTKINDVEINENFQKTGKITKSWITSYL